MFLGARIVARRRYSCRPQSGKSAQGSAVESDKQDGVADRRRGRFCQATGAIRKQVRPVQLLHQETLTTQWHLALVSIRLKRIRSRGSSAAFDDQAKQCILAALLLEQKLGVAKECEVFPRS